MVVKLTCNRPYASSSHIDFNLEGIPYHTTHKETNLEEYIKRKLNFAGDTNGTDPLLEDRVQISQPGKDMHDFRSPDPFPFSIMGVYLRRKSTFGWSLPC
jgi:hypothetical protein